MKKLFTKGVWLVIAFTLCNTLPGQSQQPVTLTTQAQVDAFPQNYGKGTFSQPLVLSETGITNVDSLRYLTAVYTLTIEGTAITNVDGLRSLTMITNGYGPVGGLRITGNGGLSNIEGLSSLRKVNASLIILENAQLVDLDGLGQLDSVAKALIISDNAKLANLNGLSAVTFIGGAREYDDEGLTITGNDALTTIGGFGRLTTVGGNIAIENNASLHDLHGFESLQVSEGGFRRSYFNIDNNPALVNIDALSALRSVGGELYIANNAVLANVDGLRSLRSIGGIFAGGATQGYLVINDNPSLSNVDGLANFDSFGGDAFTIQVTNNPNLTGGCGLYLAISDNVGCHLPRACGVTFDISGNGPGVTKEGILTACGPPPALTFQNVTSSSMTVSFPTMVAGSGYIVLMRAYGSPSPDDVPVDGTSYHAGSVIGTSTIVVGLGTQTSYDVVYLQPDTPYSFDVYPFNGGYDYLTESVLSGHQSTTGEQTHPSGIVFSDVTDNSLSLSFEAPPGNSQGYLILMKSFSSPLPDDQPVNGDTYSVGQVIGSGTIVVGVGTATNANVIYLEPGVDYYFNAVSYQGDNQYDIGTALEGHQQTLSSQRLAAYPNPFVDTVTIPITTTREGTFVNVSIVDVTGNVVAEMTDTFPSGTHEMQWDRSDNRGGRAPQGVYMFRVTTNTNDQAWGRIFAK